MRDNGLNARESRAVVAMLDAKDQRDEMERARRDGELVDRANVVEIRPAARPPAKSREQLEREYSMWAAWARPAQPSSMRDEPELARLRELSEEEIQRRLRALDVECAAARGVEVRDLPWNRRDGA